ncbi:hypothetical protein GGU45_000905 [Niabella hirudinis]
MVEALFNQIIKEYSGDPDFVQQITKSQHLWLEMRAADLNTIFISKERTAYGGAATACKCDMLADAARERIRFLSGWTDGIPEGDVCIGSRKIKR